MPAVARPIDVILAERCLELLRIPSVTGDEKAIADHLERWAMGLPTLQNEVERHGNCLIIGSPDNTRPCIALVGHTDTPAPQGQDRVQQEHDRIVGVGAADMKGALAVMQVLFEELNLASLPFCPVLVLYDGKAGASGDNGLQMLLERCDQLQEVDLAVAMAPTDNSLELGCLGSIQARITFRGAAAHAARPWEGDNAIHKAAPFLSELQRRPHHETTVGGLVFRDAVSVTMAHGGRARHIIPDRFELNLNYRFAPVEPLQDSTERAVANIKRLAGTAEVEVLDVAPPGPVPLSNPILDHWRHLSSLPVNAKQAWTDVARLAAAGIDAVNFGPGMSAQAHELGEWVSLQALVKAYESLAQLLKVPLVA